MKRRLASFLKRHPNIYRFAERMYVTFASVIRGTPALSRLVKRLWCVRALAQWGMRSGVAMFSMSGNRRLLMVYDLSSQPLSIGDILVFQEASLALRLDLGADRVDFALVYDPDSPVVPHPAFAGINSENFLFNLASVLPVVQVNPHLGSVFLFDCHQHFERFVLDNVDHYHVWPTLCDYASREYLYYHVFNELLFEHHRRHGVLPRLASRKPVREWADAFLAAHASPAVPVTVQLRRNPANPARDSDFDAWLSFLRGCMGNYPAKFILIGGHAETDPRFRELANVLIAKDYRTTLEQDLALVEASAIHFGAGSGPGTMAVFSSKPYCLFNTDIRMGLYRGMVREGHLYRLFFATSLQNFIFDAETPALLTAEFDRIWRAALTATVP